MKSIISALLVILALSNCKKNYTCECFGPGGVLKTYDIKDTKKKAKKKCLEYSAEYQDVPWSETGCLLRE